MVSLQSRRPQFCTKLLLLTFMMAAGVQAETGPKVAAHIETFAKGNNCSTAPMKPCNSGELNLTVQGSIGVGYSVYVYCMDVTPSEGLGAVAWGIDFNDTLGLGVDVFSWSGCGDGEFSASDSLVSWPEAGSGIISVWDAASCDTVATLGDLDGQQTKVLGHFYVYAYSADVFKITKRLYLSNPDFVYSNCVGFDTDLVYPGNAGAVSFGTSGGHDPCQ